MFLPRLELSWPSRGLLFVPRVCQHGQRGSFTRCLHHADSDKVKRASIVKVFDRSFNTYNMSGNLTTRGWRINANVSIPSCRMNNNDGHLAVWPAEGNAHSN